MSAHFHLTGAIISQLLIWNLPNLLSAEYQNNSTIHVFLGDSATFPLTPEQMKTMSGWTLKKRNMIVSKWKNNVLETINENYTDRLDYANGTIRLGYTKESDAGLYELELYNIAGQNMYTVVINLFIICEIGFSTVHGDFDAPVSVFTESQLDPVNVSEARWEKAGFLVAQLDQYIPAYSEEYRHRAEIFTSGMCRLFRAHVDDAGNHTLEVTMGSLRKRWTTELVVKMPQLDMRQTCLSDRKAEFRCSVSWPRPIPTVWNLNGSLLQDKNVIVLERFDGKLFCTLEQFTLQNVSTFFTCTDTLQGVGPEIYVSVPVVSVILAAAVCCGLMRKNQRQRQASILMGRVEAVSLPEEPDTVEFPPPPPPLIEDQVPPLSPSLEMTTFTI